MCNFARKFVKMKKSIIIAGVLALLVSSCANEYNAVYKTTDTDYKYEYAKECYVKGLYNRAYTMLSDLVIVKKGTDDAQECLYMMAMAAYYSGDYQVASEAFKKYVSTYPRGLFAEKASFYNGESLYLCTPEPRLDQSATYSAINAYQDYLDRNPDGLYKKTAQERMFELQDKLVEKELLNAQMYFDLGSYFGNCSKGGSNYEACIITAQNAIKDYPYTKMREKFAVLIMKSKYGLAKQSVEERKLERYRDAEDECYGFLNEFPDSKSADLAKNYIEHCKKVIKD